MPTRKNRFFKIARSHYPRPGPVERFLRGGGGGGAGPVTKIELSSESGASNANGVGRPGACLEAPSGVQGADS